MSPLESSKKINRDCDRWVFFRTGNSMASNEVSTVAADAAVAVAFSAPGKSETKCHDIQTNRTVREGEL